MSVPTDNIIIFYTGQVWNNKNQKLINITHYIESRLQVIFK